VSRHEQVVNATRVPGRAWSLWPIRVLYSAAVGGAITAAASDVVVRRDPASFRDRDATVYSFEGSIYRALRARGLTNWLALREAVFFADALAEGKVVATEDASGSAAFLGLDGDVDGLLRHEQLPFVSYPYEWPFEMLRDAALLELELLRAALLEGFVLKDGSPYNVQWRGAVPVFIDVGSFEPLAAGTAWAGYRQFCMQFLNPLLLNAHKGIDFQPLLRGRLEGITPAHCRNLLSARDLFRRGVLGHVWLHSRLERRYASRSEPLAEDLRRAGFKHELILANVRKLQAVVSRLEWRPEPSAWSGYAPAESYSNDDEGRKLEFVRDIVRSRRWPLVWDLGCNDGRYARLASESADYVVAMDADHAVVNRLYSVLKAEGARTILPLVVDVADPSPGLGWRGVERRKLEARGTPTLVVCLALVHHLALSSNVPLPELVAWLASLDASLVVEFVSADDPMAQRLLARKPAGLHGDYTRDAFEYELARAFTIERREELGAGTRTLYFACRGT
jgi:SAM-dependent methyltransferase